MKTKLQVLVDSVHDTAANRTNRSLQELIKARRARRNHANHRRNVTEEVAAGLSYANGGCDRVCPKPDLLRYVARAVEYGELPADKEALAREVLADPKALVIRRDRYTPTESAGVE